MDNSSLDINEIYNALQKQAYATIPFSLSRSVIEDTVAAFFKFLEEPEH